MNVRSDLLTTAPPSPEERESWTPMIAITLGQAIMSFNVAALPVSLSGMVASFGVPPTTIATGIVMYSLAVAGFVMLGAKLVQRFGSTAVFRIVVAVFGAGQVLMTFSPTATLMLASQLVIGLAAAVNVPALVALIAHHYRGQQQATAIGALGSARAGAGVAAFLIGGMLGTFIGWRPVFGLLIAVCAIVFFLSLRLKPEAPRPEMRIDLVGVVLAAACIILIVFGVNNLNRWGLGAARPGAPFDILGMSPAPLMIVVGVVLLQAFIAWCRRVQDRGGTPLLDLRVITSNQERAAVIAMFSVVALEAMLNFSVPLYIQIVQGRTPIETAIAMLPFNLTVFFTAMLVVRLYRTFTPRVIGMAGFAICTVALLWLAFVVRNDWSAPVVMTGLILFGIGQGALVTLVFNVLVTAAPKELAGDVGSLRGTAQNLAAGVGTAAAGALLVALLSANVMRAVADNPRLPAEIQSQVDLDSINFVNNNRLREVMARTTASPDQVEAAVEVNAAARLRALKIGLLIMACVSLLTILPASRLPNYKPEELPSGADKRSSGGTAPAEAPGFDEAVPAVGRA
jgi:predicted MFS family arabinose efflux permease